MTLACLLVIRQGFLRPDLAREALRASASSLFYRQRLILRQGQSISTPRLPDARPLVFPCLNSAPSGTCTRRTYRRAFDLLTCRVSAFRGLMSSGSNSSIIRRSRRDAASFTRQRRYYRVSERRRAKAWYCGIRPCKPLQHSLRVGPGS
jgi:hypothetical protein